MHNYEFLTEMFQKYQRSRKLNHIFQEIPGNEIVYKIYEVEVTIHRQCKCFAWHDSRGQTH